MLLYLLFLFLSCIQSLDLKPAKLSKIKPAVMTPVSVSTCIFAGFNCCKKPVTSAPNNMGYAYIDLYNAHLYLYSYGFENGLTCISAKECSTCLPKSTTTSTTPTCIASKTTVITKTEIPVTTCSFAGFPCCIDTPNPPAYDKNGYAYGFENSKSCIISNECKVCIGSQSKPTVPPLPTATNCNYFGFPCCQSIVISPGYDVNGYAYGSEVCIIFLI